MAKLTPLSNWLIEQPKQIVATQMGENKSTEELVQQVSHWVKLLSRKKGNRWAVYHTDAFEFLSILLALWQLGKTACVPGDNCEGTISQLTGYVDGFIGDFPQGIPPPHFQSNYEPVSWLKVDSNTIAIEIYTSGSTGQPKAITKTLSQLELELETLESQWPSEEGVVLTTVSHQHLYGMTFRLLWPFSAGKPFTRQLCEYSEDIFHHACHYPLFSIISSPSHLSRINTAISWHKLKGHCQHLISSAAPLEKQDSLIVSQLVDAPVREIYGSSETGVIAWRIQHDTNEESMWQALPNVVLSTTPDNRLIVDSPYLGQPSPLILSDKVLFNKIGNFELVGRVDNIVKIEGKRVSLTAIENLLIAADWIKEIKALTLNRNRVEIAIIAQLTQAGSTELMLLGRRLFIKKLKENLSHHFEPTVLPRKWRFVQQMPYNAQGKLPLQALLKICEQPPIIKWPKIRNMTRAENSVELQCYIPGNLLYFDGHFDDRPILPGVTQVYWAEKLGSQLFSFDARFRRLEMIKFLQIIEPKQALTVTLDYNESKKQLTFKYQSEKGLHSSGRICFE